MTSPHITILTIVSLLGITVYSLRGRQIMKLLAVLQERHKERMDPCWNEIHGQEPT